MRGTRLLIASYENEGKRFMERLDFSPHDSCILTKSGYTDDITGIVHVGSSPHARKENLGRIPLAICGDICLWRLACSVLPWKSRSASAVEVLGKSAVEGSAGGSWG